MAKKTPTIGSRNMRNLDAMVAAGEITQKQADEARAIAAKRSKSKKSLMKK